MSQQQSQLDEGIRTPPPSYDDVVKSEKLPSYKSVEVDDRVVTTQPTAEQPILVNRENPQENEIAQPRCSDFCKPYYDGETNNYFVSFFCNIFCRPLAVCFDCIEDLCGYDETRPVNMNRNRNNTQNGTDNVDYTTVNNAQTTENGVSCCSFCWASPSSIGHCHHYGVYGINDDRQNNLWVNDDDRNNDDGDTNEWITHHNDNEVGISYGNVDTGNDGGGFIDTCTSDFGGGGNYGGGDSGGGGGDYDGGGDCGGDD